MWVQNNPDNLSAAYLISVLNKNKISYDDAIAHVLAHAASFKCPRLGIIVREVFAIMRHRKTGHSQTRHIRKTLGAFWHLLSRDKRDHPANITREDVMKFLSQWDGDAPKTWNEAFAYITSAFALAVERGWLVVSPCASIPRKPRAKHRPPAIVRDPLAALELMRCLPGPDQLWPRIRSS